MKGALFHAQTEGSLWFEMPSLLNPHYNLRFCILNTENTDVEMSFDHCSLRVVMLNKARHGVVDIKHLRYHD